MPVHPRRAPFRIPPRYNAAPSQELWAIRQNHDSGERSLNLLRWGGPRPHRSTAKPMPPPINAKSETVARLPMFRDAYRRAHARTNLPPLAATPAARLRAAAGARWVAMRPVVEGMPVPYAHTVACLASSTYSMLRCSCSLAQFRAFQSQ